MAEEEKSTSPDNQTEAQPEAEKSSDQAENKQKSEKSAEQADTKAKAKKSAAKEKKKEKPPPIEEKPFPEFIQEHYLPALRQALSDKGIEDLDLSFENQELPVSGESCWQVIGRWQGGRRQFLVGFPKEDISELKVFSLAMNGAKPSTLESFMIDERKVSLDLLVLYVLQRLNSQKWLDRN